LIPEVLAKYGPKLIDGFLLTLQLVSVSVLLGAALAMPITLMRRSRRRILAWPALAYVTFFRGTPLLAQTFLIYYGAGQFNGALKAAGLWGFFRDPVNCAILTFTLNTAAYQAEIFRGAIAAVPRPQWEAAAALALGRRATWWRVILPQAAAVALRPFGNEIILMIKGSAIASVITVQELMGQTERAFSRSFDLSVYLYAAVLYLVVVEVIRQLWNRMEAYLTRHLGRDVPADANARLSPNPA
jgi:polar amino acid transport system permease protein